MGAKELIVTEVPRVSGLATSVSAGGTLSPNTTYYYGVVGVTQRFNAEDTRAVGWWAHSPMSEPISGTTTSTDKTITLTFSGCHNADQYLVVRSETPYLDAFPASGTFISPYGTNNTSVLGSDNETLVDDGSLYASYKYFIYPSGMPLFELRGGTEEDPMTEEWLYQEMHNQGYGHKAKAITTATGDRFQYLFEGVFLFGYESSNHSHFKIQPSRNVVFDGAFYSSAYGYMYAGESEDDEDALSKNGVSLGFRGWHGANGSITSLPFVKFYDTKVYDIFDGLDYDTSYSYFQFPANGCTAFTNFTNNVPDKAVIKDCLLRMEMGNAQFNGGWKVKRGYIYGQTRFEGARGDWTPEFDGVTSATYRNYTYANPFIYLKGVTLVDHPNYSIFFHGTAGSDRVIRLVDTVFGEEPPSANQSSNEEDGYYYQRFSLNLKITDPDGNAISGAQVQVTDVNGRNENFVRLSDGFTYENVDDTETTFIISGNLSQFTSGQNVRIAEEIMSITDRTDNYLTVLRGQENTKARHSYTVTPIEMGSEWLVSDVSGMVSGIECLQREMAGKAASPYYDITTFTPHTVTIQASGYQTKTMAVTMDEKRDMVVTIEPELDYIAPGGYPVFKNLNGANSGNKTKWIRQ